MYQILPTVLVEKCRVRFFIFLSDQKYFSNKVYQHEIFVIHHVCSTLALLITRTRLQTKQLVDKKLTLGFTYWRKVRLSQQKWNTYCRTILPYNEPSTTIFNVLLVRSCWVLSFQCKETDMLHARNSLRATVFESSHTSSAYPF